MNGCAFLAGAPGPPTRGKRRGMGKENANIIFDNDTARLLEVKV